ncbi:hypothetical protein BC2230_10388 [Burkholderia cepacia]
MARVGARSRKCRRSWSGKEGAANALAVRMRNTMGSLDFFTWQLRSWSARFYEEGNRFSLSEAVVRLLVHHDR